MPMIAAISSPRPTPLVRMTLLHMRPQVSCWMSSKASSTDAAVWVAPNFWAVSRLNSTGSMAKIRSAPARRAPCTAADPSPPTPTTATLSPGRTSAAYTAEPQPVVAPHPSRQILSRGRSSRTFTADHSCTMQCSANVPRPAITMASWPRAWMRAVPSSISPPMIAAPLSHRFEWPSAQNGH